MQKIVDGTGERFSGIYLKTVPNLLEMYWGVCLAPTNVRVVGVFPNTNN